MKARLDIIELTSNIKKFITEKKGAEKIFLHATGGAVDLSELSRITLEKVNQYYLVEKSLTARVETLQQLSSSLRSLSTRISPPKSFSQRILYQLGIGLNPTEKQLWKTIRKVEQTKQEPYLLVRILKKIRDVFVRSLVNLCLYFLDGTENKIKQCAFRTVKNLKFREMNLIDDRLHGATFTLTSESLQNDLEQFLKIQGPSLARDQIKSLEEILAQLKFSHSLYYETALLGSVFYSQSDFETKLADLSYEIEKKVLQLEIGQNVMIPGGYSGRASAKTTGHAVIYEIARTGTEEFQFAIYNTGEGAEFGKGWWEIFKMVWNWAAKPVAFCHLPLQAVIDPSFLIGLLRFHTGHFEDKKKDPIKALLSHIQNHCQITHKGTRAFLPANNLQSWGSCAFDSILCYIKAHLSPELFQSLETFMASKARKELDTLLSKAGDSKLLDQYTIDLIDRKSREILCPIV